MTYYAKLGPGEVIAKGATYRECADAALKTGLWDCAPGTVAPYYITTIPPSVKPPRGPGTAK